MKGNVGVGSPREDLGCHNRSPQHNLSHPGEKSPAGSGALGGPPSRPAPPERAPNGRAHVSVFLDPSRTCVIDSRLTGKWKGTRAERPPAIAVEPTPADVSPATNLGHLPDTSGPMCARLAAGCCDIIPRQLRWSRSHSVAAPRRASSAWAAPVGRVHTPSAATAPPPSATAVRRSPPARRPPSAAATRSHAVSRAACAH